MTKKIIMACMALVALAAFALPASASAASDPQVTHPTGTLLATGTKITGTLVNGTSKMWNTEKTSVQLECTSATTTGELVKNSASSVEGKITSAIYSGSGGTAAGEPGSECTGTFGVGTSVTPQVSAAAPWCLKALSTYAADEFRIGSGNCGAGSGEGKVKFILAPTGLSACTYESTGIVAGTYTTDTTGDAVLTVAAVAHNGTGGATNGFKKLEGGSFLCPTSSQLEMSFTLELDQETTTPVFIS